MQGGSYLTSIIILPWLTRALGVDGFGQLSFILAFISYFVLLVDWGFGYCATKKISIHRYDKLIYSKIFWDTFFARLLLAAFGFFLLLFILWIFPKFNSQAPLYLISYLIVLASVCTPAFYYQGIERLGAMVVVNLCIKLSSVPFIFIFVTSKEDLPLAVCIQAGFIFLASLINFIGLMYSGDLIWVGPKLNSIRDAILEGWSLFLSTASISLYTNSNVVILGLVADSAAVAYFVAAQTIIRAGQGLFVPISQSLFPRISYLFANSKDSAIDLLRKIIWIQGAFSALISIFVFIAAPIFVEIIFGEKFEMAAAVLRWLSPTLFLIGLSNVFGIQGMVPLGYSKSFSHILLGSGLFNIIAILPLGYFYGAIGGSAAALLTECLVTLLMMIYLKTAEPRLFKLQA
ncbi:MAG: hypothetical protein RLZ10_3045 [Bacteroidota bacterium]